MMNENKRIILLDEENKSKFDQRFEEIKDRIEKIEKKLAALNHSLTETEEKTAPSAITFSLPDQKIFHKGQTFDAHVFVSDMIRSAKRSVILVDNNVDKSVLLMLSKRSLSVDAKIFTERISSRLRSEMNEHNANFHPIEIEESHRFASSFLVIDDTVYHICSSLKDIGKKLFVFSKMEVGRAEILKGL